MSGPVEALSDRVLFGMLSESPDLAMTLGIPAVAGKPLPHARLPDFSEDGDERRRSLVRGWAKDLSKIPANGESLDESLTRRVLGYVLERGFYGCFSGLAGHESAAQLEPLTHLRGVHEVAMSMLVRDAVLHSAEDRECWVERLSRLPAALEAAARTLRSRRKQRLAAPWAVLERAHEDIRGTLEAEVPRNVFRETLKRSLPEPGDVRAQRLLETTDDLLRGPVRTAYATLLAELKEHLRIADMAVSARRRRGGEAFYHWRLAGHTTSDLSAMSMHELALEELQRLGEVLQQELDTLGVVGSRTEALHAAALQDAYPSGEEGRELALADARRSVADAGERLRPLFNRWPSADAVVSAYSRADEASQHTSYVPSPQPGAPATFRLNLAHASAGTRGECAVTAWHEVWPGHHLQLALALELPLPAFRRAMLFSGYLEGWAKYAEGLAASLLAASPHTRIARLRMELYSTATLALDTGIHAHGWSAEAAAEFFQRETAAPDALARMVVLRSAADPGQLCAYKWGLLEMRRLRERFASLRGDAFRVQHFHDAVLGQGALPLTLLATTLERQAAQQAA